MTCQGAGVDAEHSLRNGFALLGQHLFAALVKVAQRLFGDGVPQLALVLRLARHSW